jgi:hypothetical protein
MKHVALFLALAFPFASQSAEVSHAASHEMAAQSRHTVRAIPIKKEVRSQSSQTAKKVKVKILNLNK